MSNSYEIAKERYAALGVDTEAVLEKLQILPVSLHCWQGDDVGGFDRVGDLTGGIQVTGNYPGKANTPAQLRQDLEEALRLLPGTYKVNLHASYCELNREAVDRDKLEPKHFQNWVNWAKEQNIGLDFNPTYFSHPKSDDGFTLSHKDESIRKFWVEHGKACRNIGEYFGKELDQTCVINFWIPDGYKDVPADRVAPRARLKKSLDEIFERQIDPKYVQDAVESKVFGIGSESYVVGSHEFYLGYAVANNKVLTLDNGHFHPTEGIADKISSVLQFTDKLLLHVSRPVRWDSDHVVLFNDDTMAIAQELIRNNLIDRTYVALDFFDGSINRIAAWVIGARNTQKALLYAMLEPYATLQQAEEDGDYTTRLAIQEEMKFMPYQAVWDEYCRRNNTPVGLNWLTEVKNYEKNILANR
ncbi:MAG: L-rhamnose isomerase [Ruminococcaceae bacterium]|nr:L-rhamnose isomerase [Oscillospiraceae bacterium]